MGCDDGHESFLGPFVGNEEEEWGGVEKRMRTTMTRGENGDDPVGSSIGGGRGG